VSKSRLVACPNCGATLEWTPAARWRPFCSERCKMIDLGAWASERYRVPVAENPEPDGEAIAPDDRGSPT
jgi:endogenous inhibitor of DNA gyrase (YacG/DUF329 family)